MVLSVLLTFAGDEKVPQAIAIEVRIHLLVDYSVLKFCLLMQFP